MAKGDFIIREIFQFDGKWYGVLLAEGYDDFKRYVKITNIYPGGYDWFSMNETMENAVKYFYEKDNTR